MATVYIVIFCFALLLKKIIPFQYSLYKIYRGTFKNK